MNMMMLDGYRARIACDPELDLFRGEIMGLNGSADFYGKSPAELRREFRKSLHLFLEVCREKNIEPVRSCSGRFNLRIPPERLGGGGALPGCERTAGKCAARCRVARLRTTRHPLKPTPARAPAATAGPVPR
jgi:predicted HicB family RNase H-like nuclease